MARDLSPDGTRNERQVLHLPGGHTLKTLSIGLSRVYRVSQDQAPNCGNGNSCACACVIGIEPKAFVLSYNSSPSPFKLCFTLSQGHSDAQEAEFRLTMDPPASVS